MTTAAINGSVLLLLLVALVAFLATLVAFLIADAVNRAVARDWDRRAPGVREPAQLYKYDPELGCVPLDPQE